MTFPRIQNLQTVDRHFESLDPHWDRSLNSWPLNKLIFLAMFLVLVYKRQDDYKDMCGSRQCPVVKCNLSIPGYLYNPEFEWNLSFKITRRLSKSIYVITPQLITVYCLKKKWTKNNILPEMLNSYLRTKNKPNSRNIQIDTFIYN